MSANPTPSPAMVRKVVIASILGNAFEWFDFAIYGLFAVTIARLYFPADNALASLMLTLATFGIGFAVRPLGGVLLGLYGDRVGRKKALSVTIVLMAVGTGMIGLLPTYAAIGVAAPILMVLARMIQGMSAGGEFSGATTMLVEFAPAHRRGFFGSFQMCSQALAFSLGAAVAYLLTTHLDPVQLETWGWRLPFLFGILIGPVGWLIRSKVDESPEFLAYRRSAANASEQATRTPLRDILRKYPRELISSTGICVVGTVSAYVFVFFLPIFAKQRLGIATADANLSTFVGTAVILVFCPLAGYLSDRYGRKAILLPGMLGYGVAAWFLFHHFISAPSFQSLLMLQIGVSFFMSFIWAPVPIVLTEVFPVGVRSTGAALTYNLAVLLFGGLAPFINTWLVKVTGSNAAPLYYVMFSLLIGVVSTVLLPEASRGSLRARAAS
ncbi:Predicted arabinose efflux permease, MFS family [Paraburkholderia fungorum]|uniref:Predicted arabinose efflux permease, MFS family n=1 Tax=Paraburkholderia fungorum TaxID=134537 RepID=A0A1H1IQX2_9BURK|nr:MFS transporter [Paraburkholderia fungorum]SDR40097.1 Predicted arabinose efflux permease, MFS family [Paraburkholderia fungorum]